MISTHSSDRRIDYDGSQLHAHWILRTFGIVGDAVVAFRGACAVRTEEIADLEDLDGPGIAGDDMLHFISERFDESSLRTETLRQRLLAAIALDALRAQAGSAFDLRREGDDLWVGDRKLSISVATRSAVSTLTHFALNVTTGGVPVAAAAGLAELGVDPAPFAADVLQRLVAEEESLTTARAKVRARGEVRT